MMKHLKSAVIALWAGVVWIIYIPSAAGSENFPQVGKAVQVDGNAVIISSLYPEGRPITPGLPIHQNDLIKTFDGSRVRLLFQDDSVIVVGPNSQLEVNENVFSPLEDKRLAIFKLLSGKVRVLVGRHTAGSGSRFEIYTPTAVTGVRGTHFIIEVFDENYTRIFTLEGELLVRNIMREIIGEIIVRGNMMTEVTAGFPPLPAVEIPSDLFESLLPELAIRAGELKISSENLETLKNLLSRPVKVRLKILSDREPIFPRASALPFPGGSEGWRAMNPWKPQVKIKIKFPNEVYYGAVQNIFAGIK